MPRWPYIGHSANSQSSNSSGSASSSASTQPIMAIDTTKASRGMNDDEKENNNDGLLQAQHHSNGVGDMYSSGSKVMISGMMDTDGSNPDGSPKPTNGLYPHKLSAGADMECDMDLGQGPGGSGGRSGRRKQSKPARVFMDAMDTEAGGKGVGEQSGAATGEAVSTEQPAASGQMEMEVDEVITCDLCNDVFPTQSALTEHIQVTHALAQDDQEPVQPYPTKYHQLGSELQQEAVYPSPKAVKLQDASHSDDARSPPSRTGSNGSVSSQNGSSNSKSRIFHQDAYCKLCDREFCNKYFLKIHMANKHGVYEEGLQQPQGAGSVTNGTPTTIPQQQQPAGGAPEYHSTAPKSGSHISGLSQEPPTASQPPILPMPVTTSMPTTPVAAPKPAPIPPVNNKPLVSTPQKSSTKPSPDMEDYCEICQKHFCNKYYLRKHKHDVHGIVPEQGFSSGSKKSRGPSSSNNSSSTTGPNPLLLPQTSTSTVVSGASSIPGLSSMANVMFINPFAPPVAILQAQPVLQGSGAPAFPPPPLPNLPGLPTQQPPSSSTPVAETSPKTSSSSSASTSPSSRTTESKSSSEALKNLKNSSLAAGQLPSDALRNMGMLDTQAYCDICRKEFCNKYFLSIHKANKHGVFVDEGLGPLLLPGLTPGVPDNLALRSMSGPELGETTPIKGMDGKLDGKVKAEGQGEIETCEICKKEFNNKFSLKIHLINAHNIKPQDFDLGLELYKSEKMNGGANIQGTMFSNMIAAKMADRVTCDICNKEVCNKYFLKTHKMKVHGIDPAELDRQERERDQQAADNKGTPTKAATPAPGSATSPAEAAKEVLQRPNDEELLKMGIDPEAYCEICRKEFCSKYFLKTHKANIHGIKSESSCTSLPVSMPAVSMPSMQATMAKFTAEQSLMRPQLPFGLPQPGPSLMPLPGSLPFLPSQLPDHRSSPDSDSSKSGNKWMWKEPINQTRVMCEICNKELCNKYFLKTHMMKKHGIYYDVTTGQSTMPGGIPGIPPRPLDGKDADSSNDTPVSSSAPTPQPTPTPPHDSSSMGKDVAKADPAPEDLSTAEANSVVSAKTWNVPPQQQADSNKHHLQASQELQERAVAAAANATGEVSLQKCDLCGMMFGEQVTLQFHMIRDHQGQVMVRTPSSSSSQAPGNSRQDDTITEAANQACLSLKKKYQKRKLLRSAKVKAIGERVRSAIVNHLKKQGGGKKFRCAHCKERFVSRGQCKAHIRAEHPGASPNHPARHAVQAFSLSELLQNQGEGAHFPADSLVYLPVLEQISQPITATITLTPRVATQGRSSAQ